MVVLFLACHLLFANLSTVHRTWSSPVQVAQTRGWQAPAQRNNQSVRRVYPVTMPGTVETERTWILAKGGREDTFATVSEKTGRWFVCIQVEEEIPDPEPAQGVPVGVDLGIPTLATCSDGTSYENPKALQKAHKKLRRLQRKLSRQDKGSSNREKTCKKIAQLHFRIATFDRMHSTKRPVALWRKPSRTHNVHR